MESGVSEWKKDGNRVQAMLRRNMVLSFDIGKFTSPHKLPTNMQVLMDFLSGRSFKVDVHGGISSPNVCL